MKKKLDLFNLFYSVGAVIILVGVIAKLLEWEVQDIFMTIGLTMEAIVFGASSIKYHYVSVTDNASIDNLDSILMNQLGNVGNKEGNVKDDNENILLGEKANGTVLVDAGFKNNHNNLSNKVDTIYDLVVDNQIKNELNEPIEIEQKIAATTKTTNSLLPSLSDPAPIDYLWQLDKMGLISVSKDIFYQPEWLLLKDATYNQLADLMLKVFNKKMLSKKDLKTLYNYAIVIPVSTLSELKVNEPTVVLNENEVELIYNAFKVYRYNGFFEQFVIEEKNNAIEIRNKEVGEIQIFGGESNLIINHCRQYYSHEFIVSPNISRLSEMIKVKDDLLLDMLIKKLDVNDTPAFNSLIIALFDKKDYIKMQLLNKLPKIKYDIDTNAQFELLKTVMLSIKHLFNKASGIEFLKNNVSFQKAGVSFTLNDLIIKKDTEIEFGKDKITFKLADLFDDSYLNNVNYILELVDKLENQADFSREELLAYFGIEKESSNQAIYSKFTNYIAQKSLVPNSIQMEYVNAHKKYNK